MQGLHEEFCLGQLCADPSSTSPCRQCCSFTNPTPASGSEIPYLTTQACCGTVSVPFFEIEIDHHIGEPNGTPQTCFAYIDFDTGTPLDVGRDDSHNGPDDDSCHSSSETCQAIACVTCGSNAQDGKRLNPKTPIAPTLATRTPKLGGRHANN